MRAIVTRHLATESRYRWVRQLAAISIGLLRAIMADVGWERSIARWLTSLAVPVMAAACGASSTSAVDDPVRHDETSAQQARTEQVSAIDQPQSQPPSTSTSTSTSTTTSKPASTSTSTTREAAPTSATTEAEAHGANLDLDLEQIADHTSELLGDDYAHSVVWFSEGVVVEMHGAGGEPLAHANEHIVEWASFGDVYALSDDWFGPMRSPDQGFSVAPGAILVTEREGLHVVLEHPCRSDQGSFWRSPVDGRSTEVHIEWPEPLEASVCLKMANGVQVFVHGDAEGNALAIETSAGPLPLGDDYPGCVTLSFGGGLIAYSDHRRWGPHLAHEFVVRSTSDGSLVGRWEVEQPVCSHTFDGRFILAEVMQPYGERLGILSLDTHTGTAVFVESQLGAKLVAPYRVVSGAAQGSELLFP